MILNETNQIDRKIFVFDVDGTLANGEHRQGHLRKIPRDWEEYKNRAADDLPHEDIIWLLKTFYYAGHIILIATARTEDEREPTVAWFRKHGIAGHYHEMFMRPTLDYRDDTEIKLEMLDTIVHKYGSPFMVFDDRNRVVDMWRSNGVRCLQVQLGDF